MVTYQIVRTNLQPQFDTDCFELLNSSSSHWIVTWGFRTFLEQQKLYDIYLKGGPLAAPPGKSAHNYGLAIDIVLATPQGWSYNKNDPAWLWLFARVLAHPRLHSGKGFGDFDHIERYKWYNFLPKAA